MSHPNCHISAPFNNIVWINFSISIIWKFLLSSSEKKKVKVIYIFSTQAEWYVMAVKVENILKHMYHSYTFDCHGLNGLAFQMHKNYDKCITANYNSDDRNIDWFESLVG